MKYKCSLIVVKNMKKARAFYEDILGQKVIYDFGANLAFEGGFCLQTRESWAGFIKKPVTDVMIKSNNSELYFEEADLEALIAKLNTYGNIEYVHGLEPMPWGQRVIRFYDPDWNIIEVGESMESVVKRFLQQGLSLEETARRTQHPLEFVKQLALK